MGATDFVIQFFTLSSSGSSCAGVNRAARNPIVSDSYQASRGARARSSSSASRVVFSKIDIRSQETNDELQPIGFFEIAQELPTKVGTLLLEFEGPVLHFYFGGELWQLHAC